MEFFRVVEGSVDAGRLQEELTIATLDSFCDSIDRVIRADGDEGEIYCLWGQFHVHRERVNGGVRFTLPTCPNALQWTVTSGFPPAEDGVVLHASINRTEHDPDFIESIEMFLDDWVSGLQGLSR